MIVTANAIARERMVAELRPRLPASCIYVVTDAGWRNCKTVEDYVALYGAAHLPDILSGAEELPAYGLLNLAEVPRRDMSKIPRTLSRFSVLDSSIGGFYSGELSVWTGKRGIGKSTLLSQMLLEALDQGHTVCAYSGELPKEQFREWTYLQAAGPEHIRYITDQATGKNWHPRTLWRTSRSPSGSTSDSGSLTWSATPGTIRRPFCGSLSTPICATTQMYFWSITSCPWTLTTPQSGTSTVCSQNSRKCW